MNTSRAGFLGVSLVGLGIALAGCRHHPSADFADLSRVDGPPPVARAGTVFTNRLDPAWLKPSADLFRLGPGDRLEIQLLGQEGTRRTTIVGPDGKIYFDLLPGIDVWGLTLAQARARLEQAYSQYVREPPQFSLTLRDVESRRVWILGRVQVPGVYTLTAPMTLLEAVSLAGGTTKLTAVAGQEALGLHQELADLKRSFVVRAGRCLPVDFKRLLVDGDPAQNIYLEPDDFVYFPAAEAQTVYVLGAVTQPRAVPYRPGLTVAAAVAGAYGAVKGAYLSHVAVVRGSLSQPELTVVNLVDVIRGKKPDLQLQPDDIVYVPVSPFEYVQHYVNVIIDTFVSSAAIDAGEKVVGVPQTFSQGVFIPLGSGIQIIPPAAPPPIH